MSTIIEARKSDGTLIGRCDDRCHSAKNPKCTCICGGANHGVGFDQAVENTQRLLKENGFQIPDGEKATVTVSQTQLKLL